MNKITLTESNLKQIVDSAARRILKEYYGDNKAINEIDMNTPEYRNMYDAPDKLIDKNYDISQGFDALDRVGDEWLTHDPRYEDEDFPRIKKGERSAQEKNGEWGRLARPATGEHIESFLFDNGVSLKDVQNYIKRLYEKLGVPHKAIENPEQRFYSVWSKSKFAKLKRKYVDEYKLDWGMTPSIEKFKPDPKILSDDNYYGYFTFDYFGEPQWHNKKKNEPKGPVYPYEWDDYEY